MAAISALILALIGFITEYRVIAMLCVWEWIMAFFWIVLSGIFGNMYLHENPEMDNGIERMKTAVAFDLYVRGLTVPSSKLTYHQIEHVSVDNFCIHRSLCVLHVTTKDAAHW